MFERDKEELIAVFDVGSGSVGGALVIMPKEEGGRPEFIASDRFPVLFEANLNPKKFEIRMLNACREVGQKIALAKPSRVFCFLASPWLSHQTREVRFTTKTALISRKEVGEIVNGEISNFHQTYLKDYPDAQLGESKIQSLVARKKDTRLEKNLTLFLGVSQDKIMTSIKDIITETLKTTKISFNSFLLSQFSLVRDFFAVKNFLLMDVSGEMTEIAKVTDNILIDSVSFPLGKNSLIRRFGEVAPDNAETLLSLFLDDRLDEKNKVLAAGLLGIEKKHWQKHLETALKKLSIREEPIFLTADDEVASWFIDGISTLTKTPFRCIFLEAKSLMPFCHFKSGLKPDPFLTIEVLSLETHEI